MSRVTRDGTAEPLPRDQFLRREGGQGNTRFPCSADHEQDWQPYSVDPYSCYMCDHTSSEYSMPNNVGQQINMLYDTILYCTRDGRKPLHPEIYLVD